MMINHWNFWVPYFQTHLGLENLEMKRNWMNIGGVNSENHRSTSETTRAVLETEFHICMACIFSFKTIHMPILDQTLP
jgi:hypothetical protein